MSTLKVDNLLLQDNTKGTGRILETFGGVCNAQSFDVLSGTYQLENVTSSKGLTTSYVDVPGSSITYTPPEGTKTVIYNFVFANTRGDAGAMAHFKLFLDSDEVLYARLTSGSNSQYGELINYTWSFRCNASLNDTNTGSVTSWTGPKTIKMQAREYSSSNEGVIHNNYYWDGATSSQFHIPILNITAIG